MHFKEIVKKQPRTLEDRKFTEECEHEICQKVPCEVKAAHEVIIDI